MSFGVSYPIFRLKKTTDAGRTFSADSRESTVSKAGWTCLSRNCSKCLAVLRGFMLISNISPLWKRSLTAGLCCTWKACARSLSASMSMHATEAWCWGRNLDTAASALMVDLHSSIKSNLRTKNGNATCNKFSEYFALSRSCKHNSQSTEYMYTPVVFHFWFNSVFHF